MHNDAVILMETLLREVSCGIEDLQTQTAECMGDVQIVNALLDVQMAYNDTASAIKAALQAVR